MIAIPFRLSIHSDSFRPYSASYFRLGSKPFGPAEPLIQRQTDPGPRSNNINNNNINNNYDDTFELQLQLKRRNGDRREKKKKKKKKKKELRFCLVFASYSDK